MKKRILLLLFAVISSFVHAATIYVSVDNVNGSSVAGAYIKLYNSNWGLIKTGYTNGSGMATFALLDYGTYNYEVYYIGEEQEYWGSEENISLQSPTLTSNFTRYWPYRYSYSTPSSSVYTGNQVSFSITVKNKVSFSRNVKVEIWVDRSKSSSWDFNQISSAQSISSNGTKTFTFNYTPTSTGTYYWKMNVLSYNDGSGAYIITDSYSWSSAFSAENQECDLAIYVKNVNGSYIEDAYVKLYDENWNLEEDDYTNSSGRADFNNLEYGIYHYEVYYTGDAQEFWGGDENLNINSASESETFTRNWPYRSNLTTSVDYSATYDVTVKNNLSFSRNVKVELWVDRNQSTSGGFHELSNAQSVSSNGTKIFSFNFTPSTSGTYYYKMHVLTYNDGAGEYLITDSYSWTESFSITLSTPFPLSDGILVYHAYINYESAWDSKLYTYNFSTGTKKEISSGWNIDHEMNAVASPDGSMIVFMGDNSGEPRDWDIYIWDINSSSSPQNLTNGNNLRDEDPRFSPDGSKIIFKQNGDIKVMDLNGEILSNVTSDGSTNEESMPFFNANETKIVYAKGAKATSDIYLINSDGTNQIPLYNESNLCEYFPVFKDNSSFFYTRWVSTNDEHDQIYLGDYSGNSERLSINEYSSDNSDAAPVGSDYLFFSSTRNGSVGGYDLYLGQISTGEVWNLNDFGINSTKEDLGACFIANQSFNISASISPSNGGSVSGTGSYNSGSTANLTATATSGYDFVNWTENGTQVSTNENYSFTVTSNRTLVANFEAKTYNISASASPSNGGSVSGTGSYNSGSTANLTATATSGYDFVNWTENGTQVSTNENYSFTVTSNRTLVANFEAKTYNISASASPSNGGSVSGTGSYNSGSTANLTATATSGYDFVNWTENGTQVSTNENYSFTVTSNRTLVANFEAKTYNISASISPSNGGSVSGTGSYNSGSTANLTATAASGYDFVNWTENGTQVSTNENYSFTVTSNRTLVANFEAKTYNISASISPSNGGSVSGTGSYNSGSTANLTATATSGYDFVNWTENGTQVSTNENYSFTVTSNRTLVANFEAKTYNISASISPSNGGSVSGTGSYNSGSTANLTATATSGYDFVNWTENGTQVSTNENYSFTVTSNRTLVANFTNLSCIISASSNPIEGGTVSGSGGYNVNQTCNLIAIASTGYNFVNWTENGTEISTNPEYIFAVSTSRTLVANFDNALGVFDVSEDINIKIYPNPTNGEVIVSGKNIKTIEVFNVYGNTIKEIKVSSDKTSIHLDALAKGIYIFKLTTDDKIITSKILLN